VERQKGVQKVGESLVLKKALSKIPNEELYRPIDPSKGLRMCGFRGN
jgi:hypothetical protein